MNFSPLSAFELSKMKAQSMILVTEGKKGLLLLLS